MADSQRICLVSVIILAHATRALAAYGIQTVADDQPGVPIWVIAVIVVPLVALIAGLVYFLLRKKKLRSNAGTNHVREQTSLGSFQTLVTTPRVKEEKQTNLTTPSMGDPLRKDTRENSVSEADVERPAGSTLSQQFYSTQDLSLPLPVSSGSLFADKMELSSDEAIDLFQQYMNAKSAEAADPKNDRGFISIDLSGAAANLQQKAATIRGTLRQSIRRQKSTKSTTPVNHLFSAMDPPQASTGSRPAEKSPPPTPPQPSPSPIPDRVSEATTQARPVSKTMVETEARTDLDMQESNLTADEYLAGSPVKMSADSDEDQGVKDAATSMHAARKAIRTASRKSKTRSMLVSEDVVQQMFSQEAEASPLPQPKSDESGYFASVRSRSPRVMEDITITSGSVRRLVRNSVVADGKASLSAGSRRGPGLTAQEVAGWWGEAPDVPPTPSPANLERRRFSVVSPRQAAPIMSGSATVSAKTSKALRAALPSAPEGPSNRSNTLGRNAQKAMGSARGVKSLKGLFEASTTKVSPADHSQKTQVPSLQIPRKQPIEAEQHPREDVSEFGSDQDLSSTKYAVSEDEMDELTEKYQSSTTEKKGDVNTIRRMLQATWDTNMTESESMASLMSTDVENHSSHAQASRRSPEPTGLAPPAPSTSFSSSTVQTIVPSGDKTHRLQAKPSTSSFLSKPQSNEGHSRKSSGGNSNATMIQLGSQTWTGRAQKTRPNLSQVEAMNNVEEMPSITKTGTIGRAGRDPKAFLTAARSSRRGPTQRGGLPWMEESSTPAQKERDLYLTHMDDTPSTDMEGLSSERSSWATIRPI
ncbi:hypothetical protein DFQ28_004825 [Apophysomyces sp. BC1034]|nr:hypothetical protein DFQ30_004766 [Apophysomyces sp. BC1015]KAG0175005.1 hypothetical protein DFQ29_007295 [Apophysomyces sp. BC1021]KAG0188445.1 hypothetical protein DFQ28_004825 [Apophysomyces sp. BC1034]